MKNIFIFSILLLVSCSGLKQTKVSTTKEDYDEETTKYLEGLVKEFKIVFFEKCLSKSFNDKQVDFHLGNDASYSHDYGLGRENYKTLRSLSGMVVEEIRRDSIEWTNQFCKGCTEEDVEHFRIQGIVGKKTLKFCLDYYTSEELDSIARVNIFERK